MTVKHKVWPDQTKVTGIVVAIVSICDTARGSGFVFHTDLPPMPGETITIEYCRVSDCLGYFRIVAQPMDPAFFN